jgi:hypothetical protein
MTPNPGASRPAVLRSELRFVSTGEQYSERSTISFYLDKVLVNAMRPGDDFHMARTACGGLSVSALRQEELIFAAGEISAVPLGPRIQARIPIDLIKKAQEVFHQRDTKFEFPELPIEICDGGECSILVRATVVRNGYHVWVQHGFYPVNLARRNVRPSLWMAHVTEWPYPPHRNSSKCAKSV